MALRDRLEQQVFTAWCGRVAGVEQRPRRPGWVLPAGRTGAGLPERFELLSNPGEPIGPVIGQRGCQPLTLGQQH